MRPAFLLCLFPLAFTASHAQTPTPSPAPRTPPALHKHPPASITNPTSPLTCGRTVPPNGYQPLPFLQNVGPYVEYAGSLVTWAPIDNETECHIRQLYFTIPDTVYEGPSGTIGGPDILVELFETNSTTPVKVPISFDIVSFVDGGSLFYRIDAQSQDPKRILYGDYVMKISVVATPRP
jgi:hypothetical protein